MGRGEVLGIGKVGIYSRVSTIEQNKDVNGSIKNQISRGIEFCEDKGFEYEIYNEEVGSSLVGIEYREELERLIRDIKRKEIKYVWCLGLDRLFRNPSVSFYFKELLIENDVRLFVNGDLWDLDDVGVELRYGIEQIIQRKYVEDLKGRASNAMWTKWLKGEFVFGKPPFGLSWNKDEKVLEINDEQIEKVKVLFAIIRGGEYNLSTIRRGLEFRGYKLSYSWLNKFFLNKEVSEWMYKGYLERTIENKKGEIHTNRFLVERSVFDKSEYDEIFKCMVSKKRNNVNFSTKNDLDRRFFGYGFYKCGCCGRKLYPVKRGKSGEVNVYCKNSVENKGNSRIEINRLLMRGMVKCEQKGYFRLENLESYLWYSIKRSILKSKNYGLDIIDNELDDSVREIEQYEKSIKGLKSKLRDVEIKIEQIERGFIDRDLDYDDFDKMRKMYFNDTHLVEKRIRDEEDILNGLRKKNNNKDGKDIIEEFVKLDVEKLNSIAKKKEFMMKYVDSVEVRWFKDEGKSVMKIIFKKPILDYRYMKKGESIVKLNGRIDRDKLITKYHTFKKNWKEELN
jgi:DNA invertase Pin-like site-specific DNA recombinase